MEDGWAAVGILFSAFFLRSKRCQRSQTKTNPPPQKKIESREKEEEKGRRDWMKSDLVVLWRHFSIVFRFLDVE